MKLHWSVPVATAFGIVGAALYFSVPAHASPYDDLAVEAAFCHDVRANPTVSGVRTAALQMIRIYDSPDKAAEIAFQAVTDVCPDLRTAVVSAINSPNWTGSGNGGAVV